MIFTRQQKSQAFHYIILQCYFCLFRRDDESTMTNVSDNETSELGKRKSAIRFRVDIGSYNFRHLCEKMKQDASFQGKDDAPEVVGLVVDAQRSRLDDVIARIEKKAVMLAVSIQYMHVRVF
jgi:hypothetical protein